MNLGKAIKLCRNQKDLTQSELAKLAKISESYISLLEQGKRDPNFSTIQRISEALDVPVSVIIFLAADLKDFKDFSPELVEKLSFTALNIIKSDAHDTTNISR